MDLRRKALEREFAAAWTRLRSLTALDLQARILRMLQVSGLLVQVVHVRVERTSLGAPCADGRCRCPASVTMLPNPAP